MTREKLLSKSLSHETNATSFSHQMNSKQTGIATGAGAARAHIGASRVCGTGDGGAGQRAATKRARHAGVAARARRRVSIVARLCAGSVTHQARALRAVARRRGGLGRAGVGCTHKPTHTQQHAHRPRK